MAVAQASAYLGLIEAQYVKLKGEYEKAIRDREELAARAANANDKVAAATASCLAATNALADSRLHSSSLEREVARLEGERSLAVEKAQLAEERAQQIATLRALEAKELSESRAECVAARRAAAEADARAGPDAKIGERYRQEKEAMESHCAWLEGELSRRSEEVRRSRREYSQRNSELQADLDSCRDESKRRAEAIERATEARSALEREADEARAELRDAKREIAEVRATLEADLAAEKRLAIALVEEVDAAKARAADQERVAAAAEKARLEAERKGSEQVEAAKAEAQAVLQEAAEAARSRLEELEAELREYKRRAEQGGGGMGPVGDASAAALYERCIEAERALESERAELRRAELYMERVGREIDKKRIVWEKERAAKLAALKAYDALATKYHDVANALEQAEQRLSQHDSERAERDAEKADLEQTCRDLSHQVRSLLASAATRAGVPLPAASTFDAGDDEARRLTEQMVAIGSIEQLQQRNVQLLRVVRKLASQVQELQQDRAQTDDEAATEALEGALKELDDMREARSRQEKLVSDLVAQRDSYMAQLQDFKKISSSTSSTGVLVKAADPPQSGADDETELSALAPGTNRQRVQELEVAVEAATREAALATQAKQLYADMVQSARAEAADAVKREMQARADLDFERSRSARYETAAESARAEAQRIERERDRAVAEAARWENEASDRFNELRAANSERDDARQREAEARRAKNSCEAAFERANDRAQRAEEEARKAQAAMESVERLEAALKTRVEADTTGMAARLASTEAQLDSARDQAMRLHEVHDRRCRELEARVEQAVNEAKQAEREAIEQSKELAATKASLQQAEQQLAAAQLATAVTPSSTGPAPGSVALLPDQPTVADASLVSVLRADADALRLELEMVTAARDAERTRCDELASLARSHEVVLRDARSSAEAMKTKLELELAAALEARDAAQKAAAEAKAVIETGEATAAAAVQEVSILSARLVEAQAAAADATAKVAMTERMRDDAEVSAKRAQQEAVEAHFARERELGMHVAHVAALNASTAACIAAVAERDALERELAAKSANDSAKAEEESSRVASLQADLDASERRLSDIEKQRDLLTNQLSLATETLDRLERREGEGAAAVALDDQAVENNSRAVRELRQLVELLRRDKELVDAKLAVSERSREREAAKAKAADEALVAVRSERDALLEELKQRPAHGEAASGATEAAAQQLSLLRESNTQLRAAAQRANERLAAAKREIQELRSRLGPADDELAKARSTAASLERDLEARERELTMWRARVDSLVATSRKRRDERDKDHEREIEELRRECELANAQAKDAEERFSVAKHTIDLRDAAWARDAASSASRFLRSLRTEALNRKALDNAAAATAAADAKRIAADASASTFRDELTRTETKLRKAGDVLRGFKQKNIELTAQLEISMARRAPAPASPLPEPSPSPAPQPATPPKSQPLPKSQPQPKAQPPTQQQSVPPTTTLSPAAPAFVPAPVAAKPPDAAKPLPTHTQKRSRSDAPSTSAQPSKTLQTHTQKRSRTEAQATSTQATSSAVKRTAAQPQPATAKKAKRVPPATAPVTAPTQPQPVPTQAAPKVPAARKATKAATSSKDEKAALAAKMLQLQQQLKQAKQAPAEAKLAQAQPSSEEAKPIAAHADAPAGRDIQPPPETPVPEGGQVLLKNLNQQQRRQARAARFEQQPAASSEDKKDDAPA